MMALVSTVADGFDNFSVGGDGYGDQLFSFVFFFLFFSPSTSLS